MIRNNPINFRLILLQQRRDIFTGGNKLLLPTPLSRTLHREIIRKPTVSIDRRFPLNILTKQRSIHRQKTLRHCHTPVRDPGTHLSVISKPETIPFRRTHKATVGNELLGKEKIEMGSFNGHGRVLSDIEREREKVVWFSRYFPSQRERKREREKGKEAREAHTGKKERERDRERERGVCESTHL